MKHKSNIIDFKLSVCLRLCVFGCSMRLILQDTLFDDYSA